MNSTPGDRFLPPFFVQGGTIKYPLGTDNFGRDLASRAIVGTRVSLLVSVPAVLLTAIVGSILGAVSGYRGGMIDVLIMRTVELQLSFPTILLAIIFVTVFGKGPLNLVIFIALALWVNYARLARGEAVKIREAEFVLAARAIGGPARHILLKHVLPNALTPTLALATVDLAAVVILEAALSYLGLRIQPPTPSWGVMISDGRGFLYENPWMSIVPGLCIFVLAVGVNFLGDWLRDRSSQRSFRTARQRERGGS